MKSISFVFSLSLFVLLSVGCGKTETSTPSVTAEAVHHDDHSIDGWCLEHEISENICSFCNKKYAADCKKNGDWCKEHDRAESQCFLCDPSRKEKFVAQYEAQYGKKPPQATK